MSKSLFLVRHAKSDWSDPGQKDFDRELNSRGVIDAPKMGRKLFDMGVKPDIILCSPALRAKLTCEYVTEQLKFDEDKIVYDEEIYEASTRSLLNVINNIDDKYQSAMLFGHNPTFTYIAENFTKESLGNIPTCGVVQIDFELDSWKEVSGETGKLKFFIYPKMFW